MTSKKNMRPIAVVVLMLLVTTDGPDKQDSACRANEMVMFEQ
jgi:hypothetical protein